MAWPPERLSGGGCHSLSCSAKSMSQKQQIMKVHTSKLLSDVLEVALAMYIADNAQGRCCGAMTPRVHRQAVHWGPSPGARPSQHRHGAAPAAVAQAVLKWVGCWSLALLDDQPPCHWRVQGQCSSQGASAASNRVLGRGTRPGAPGCGAAGCGCCGGRQPMLRVPAPPHHSSALFAQAGIQHDLQNTLIQWH